MRQPFNQLEVGEKFRSMKNTNIYIKINHERISCCKFYNAAEVADANKKVGFKDTDEVIKVTDEQQ